MYSSLAACCSRSSGTLILDNVSCRLGRFEVRLTAGTGGLEGFFRGRRLGFRGPHRGLLFGLDGMLPGGGLVTNVLALDPRGLLLVGKPLTRLGSLGVGERLLGVGLAQRGSLRLLQLPFVDERIVAGDGPGYLLGPAPQSGDEALTRLGLIGPCPQSLLHGVR